MHWDDGRHKPESHLHYRYEVGIQEYKAVAEWHISLDRYR